MPRLPIETRGRAIGMIQAGQSFTAVSRLLRCGYLPFKGFGRSSHKQVMIQFWGERHLKSNRYGSLPLTTPHPWVCFKSSVLPISGQMADMVRPVEAELQPKSKTTGSEHAISGTDGSQQPELLLLQLDLTTVQ